MYFWPALLLFALTSIRGEESSDKDVPSASFQHLLVGKRSGTLSSGQIFPRLGRGFHESPRPFIPFSRFLRRPFWHYTMDPLFMEYEDSVSNPASLDGMSSMPVNNLMGIGVDPTSLGEDSEVEKRNGANGGNMWFGPRLGKRRKRSVEIDSAERVKDTFDTRVLVKFLHNLNWAIVPVKQRRTFTPRLGRSGGEDAPVHHSSVPFSPRLGRSRESSVEFDQEDDDIQSRYTRSDGSGHGQSTLPPSGDDVSLSTSALVPFSPRLGRDHYSPRLGRSGGGDERK